MSESRESRESRPACELTDAEWVVMNVVWECQPCAAGTVQEALAKTRKWAYSTVKTTMDRMVNKGFLSTHHIRNLTLFSAAITDVDAKRGELRRMLKRAFDGALTPMMQFLVENDELSKEELGVLRKMVGQTKRQKR